MVMSLLHKTLVKPQGIVTGQEEETLGLLPWLQGLFGDDSLSKLTPAFLNVLFSEGVLRGEKKTCLFGVLCRTLLCPGQGQTPTDRENVLGQFACVLTENAVVSLIY